MRAADVHKIVLHGAPSVNLITPSLLYVLVWLVVLYVTVTEIREIDVDQEIVILPVFIDGCLV